MMLGVEAVCFVLLSSRFAWSETTGYIKTSSLKPRFSTERDSDFVDKKIEVCIGKRGGEGWNLFGCSALEIGDGTSNEEASLPIESNKEITHVIIREHVNEQEGTQGESANSDDEKGSVDFVEIPLMFPNDGVRHLVKTIRGYEMEISLSCEEHYYGPRCQIHCDSSLLGKRFKCDTRTGEIKCSFGWIGANCSEHIFIDKKVAFEFLSRPKRSGKRKDCSKRNCTKEELRNEFLLYGSELDDDEQINSLGAEDLDDCEDDHCNKNGTILCLRLDGEKHACRCKPGFKGDKCEVSDLCYFEPCHNGGVCQELEGSVFCECPSGFRGTFCGEKVLTCEDNPCENNGACEPDPDGFQCICIQGFSGRNCEVNPQNCPENSCNGRGQCYDGVDAYECICDEGYYGKDCEIIDPCSREPCENGGICKRYSDGVFQCNCPEEFGGVTCSEKWRDPCDDNPCNGNGICSAAPRNQDGQSPFTEIIVECICNDGYTGENCETKISPCDLEPCPENATCVDYGDEHICSCPSGYEGEFCERKCNNSCEGNELLCKSNPCENNARCVAIAGKATCICPRSFTGQYCERELDFCQGISCGNGECFSAEDGYECMCENGYTGEHCEEDINECEEQHYLCKNEGECMNTMGSYLCLCPKGYAGEHCDHKVDGCSSYPCKNGGTCHPDGIDSFQCSCKIGFVGMTCELLLDFCEENPCKNGGKCEVTSLEKQEIKCTCRESFYGIHCEEEIPICSVKKENSDGTIELIDRTECGPFGKCKPSSIEGEYECECSEGYEGMFCDQKIPFQCTDPHCVCDGDSVEDCVHETYGSGKCVDEDCLAENCTRATQFICHYDQKCINRKIASRINRSNITEQSCDNVVISFDRQMLPQEATTGTICHEIRSSPALVDTLKGAVVICSLQAKTQDDVIITLTLTASKPQGERNLNFNGAALLQVLDRIINSDGTKENNKSAIGAIMNATFDGQTISSQTEKPFLSTESEDDASTIDPVDKTVSPKEIYLIIPVAVVGSILVIAMLVTLVIWFKQNKRPRTQAPVPTSNDNNNLQNTVTWTKSSNGKSAENSVSFNVENECLTSEEKSKSPKIQDESIPPGEADSDHGVTTFVPRRGGLYSESSSSITKR